MTEDEIATIANHLGRDNARGNMDVCWEDLDFMLTTSVFALGSKLGWDNETTEQATEHARRGAFDAWDGRV